MTEDNSYKPLTLFGRDLKKIPCLRRSFLYGISGGIGCGLLTFLFTSHPKNSTHVAMGSYATITIIYFAVCRYQVEVLRYNSQKIRQAFHSAAVLQGTEDGPTLPRDKELDDV